MQHLGCVLNCFRCVLNCFGCVLNCLATFRIFSTKKYKRGYLDYSKKYLFGKKFKIKKEFINLGVNILFFTFVQISGPQHITGCFRRKGLFTNWPKIEQF